MSAQFKIAGKTNQGLVRTSNEDCLHLDEKNRVFVVCDGMGGHQAGEVASMMAADVIDIVYNQLSEEILGDPELDLSQSLPKSGDILLRAIRLANRAIYSKAVTQPTLLGMGTTVVALALEADLLSVAHVGDSRAYRLGEKALEPLTTDHSWVAEVQQNQMLTPEEASQMVGRNVITRALGVRETVEVDYRTVKVKPGDKFMICSDGLCGFADDDEIFAVMYRARNNIERMVDDLIQMANDRGGADNVTVAVLEILEVSASDTTEIEPFTLTDESPETAAAEDRWIERMSSLPPNPDDGSSSDNAGETDSRRGLFIVFAVFIVIAAVILYYAAR